MDSIRSRVTDCINSFIETFRADPHDFFFEAEIQAILYSKLKDRITEKVSLPVEIHKDLLNRENIPTGLVRAEYPSGIKYDIAIIHPQSKRRIIKELHQNEAWWNQNLIGAIELKSWRLGENPQIKLWEFSMDIEKLKKYEHPEEGFIHDFEFGLALLFLQLNTSYVKEKILQRFGKERLIDVAKVSEVSNIEGYIVSDDVIYKVIQV